VTKDVLHLIEGRVETDHVGNMTVKGIAEPVEVYELTGSIGGSPWDARSRLGLTDFTGRHEEMALLQNKLGTAVESSRGGVVTLVGGAGVGKSRLLHEFLETVSAEVFTVLKAEGSPFEANTAYHPIKTLVNNWIEETGGSLTGALEAIDPSLLATRPAFISLLDRPVDDGWLELSPQQRRRQTRDSIGLTARALATHKPLVVVIEDLHWVDSETESIVEDIVALSTEIPMLVVLTYRPTFNADWEREEQVDRLSLEPLPPEQAQEFLDCLVGSDASLVTVKPLVAARAEGTPLFLEETVRALVETGALTGTRGAYVASASDLAVDIPDSVTAIIAARIDRLDQFEKLALQVAAVAGPRVPVRLVSRVLRQPDQEVGIALDNLASGEFLRAVSSEDDAEYLFHHALIRDVAYGSLPRSERKAMHAEMVSLLEGPAGGETVERLAFHALRAELWKKAALYSLEAADKAISRSAYREASTFLREAARALENQPTSSATVVAAIDVRMRLRVAETGARGGLARLQEDLDEAARLADSIGDRPRRARVAIHAGYTANMLGDAPMAEEHAATAHEIATRLNDQYVAVESRLLLAQSNTYAGRPRTVPAILRPHMDYITRDIRFETMDQTMIRSVVATSHFAVARAAAGEFKESQSWLDEGFAIATEANRPFDLMYMYFAKGKCLDFAGKPDESAIAHETSAAIAEENDIWFMTTFAQPWRGHALLRAGRFDEADEVLRKTQAAAIRVELPFIEAESRAFASVLAKVSGGDPKPDADAALAFAARYDTPGLEMLALGGLGRMSEAHDVAIQHGFDAWAEEMRSGVW
jgi:tetratricopeptide (TPR) repeat protein